jgi:GNAT superfamily N-acetyltransferase
MIKINKVVSEDETKTAREILLEYGRIRNFDAALGDYDYELANLPGEYTPPDGCLLLAYYKDNPVGCVAIRKIDDDICEMKRLYVKEDFRGKKIGYALVQGIIKNACESGYKKMRLDNHPWMKEAESLYKLFGFVEIGAYRFNPTIGVKFFELDLEKFKENNSF